VGLESSLRWYVERETARAGLSLTLSIEALPSPPAPAVAMTCFRVVQEALTNVVRHAHARRVSIATRSPTRRAGSGEPLSAFGCVQDRPVVLVFARFG
jgi:signal transduction histidine kinase